MPADAPKNSPQPGDLILDRYLPDATPEKREEAREVLREHALLLIRIGERILAEERAKEAKNSEFID